MFRALGRVADKSDSYSFCQCVSECFERTSCSVDSNQRNDRCNCRPIDPETPDYCCLGRQYEVDGMTPIERSRHNIGIIIRFLLGISVFLFVTVGIFGVFKPDTIVFNHVADEITAARLIEGQLLREEAEKRQTELDKKANPDVNAALLQTFFNKLLKSEDVTQNEKQEIENLFRIASEKIDATHCEVTTVVAPIVMFGIYNLFYAAICLYELMHSIEILEKSTHLHLFWTASNLFGYAMVAVGRGNGMQSAALVTAMIVVHGCLLGLWLGTWKRIIDIRLLSIAKE